MATGLIALLDDIAAIAKVAAASLDDTAAAATKASAKAAGVVIDDTAVTPRYVTGFSPARELPIVAKIAMGSVRNKLLYLLPGAMALSALAPWAITPLLMMGGAYLTYEGAEKLYEAWFPHDPEELAPGDTLEVDAVAMEKDMVGGAIRTDLILSAEIMAITLASVADRNFVERAVVLAIVGVGITVLVYGAVALIVKADDVGYALAKRPGRVAAPGRVFGRALVRFMPGSLRVLAGVGTAAMLWVGGGIVLHGMESYGLDEPAHSIHALAAAAGAAMPFAGAAVEWLVGATGAGVFGLVLGGVIVAGLHFMPQRAPEVH
ncbi:MAG TPA: DUF808 domain-containing protein [Polymorphobacter sp.]|nr:DUF808 domain-containing protein [Polymorphobacter sp.]